jgi:membrane-bound ClpP family serine protease
MTLIILLFSIGILMLLAEVIIPGGILGVIGGLLMIAGSVMAFLEFGTTGGMVALAVALVVAALALYFELRILPKTRIGRRAFLTKEITAVTRAVEDDARNLIGKPAEALTMLSPSGYVRVDGRRYEAFCQSGQVPAGSALEIVGADAFRLIVSLSNQTDHHHA